MQQYLARAYGVAALRKEDPTAVKQLGNLTEGKVMYAIIQHPSQPTLVLLRHAHDGHKLFLW